MNEVIDSRNLEHASWLPPSSVWGHHVVPCSLKWGGIRTHVLAALKEGASVSGRDNRPLR